MPAAMFQTPHDIIAFFGEDPTEGTPYLTEQAPRYLRLLEVLGALLVAHRPFSLVDVGPGLQTELVRARFPEARIITVGYPDHLQESAEREAHISYDLNEAYSPATWPNLGQHDVVLLCEVIEHLYTSPVAVLECLASWLRPGGFLIVQTPNASALARRLRIMLGHPPYGRISGFGPRGMNPRHFREYTASEMVAAGEQAGLLVDHLEAKNYFARSSSVGKLYNGVTAILPASFRHGLTVVYRRPDDARGPAPPAA